MLPMKIVGLFLEMRGVNSMRKTSELKIVELFSGTGHISNAFRERGHKAWKVDWSKDLDANLHADISKLTEVDIMKLCDGVPDVIWASPDCTTYSIAATAKGGGLKHREVGSYAPKTDYAKFCDETDQHVIDLIAKLKPKYYFIENPRGLMRKMPWMVNITDKLPDAKRYTVTYCQYGGRTMKPTDVWTNHPNPRFMPPCKNGDPCHLAAPRGSTTGTQGAVKWQDIKSNGMYSRPIMRGIMPPKFIKHIVNICEDSVVSA
jgi:hypothetical protein